MVSFTDAELDELDEAAGDEPVSAFVRNIAVRYLRRRRQRLAKKEERPTE